MGTTELLFGKEATEEDKQSETETTEAEGVETTEEAKSETEVSQEEAQENFYTPEELTAIHPTAIDLERVDPKVRPIVEKTIKEYKSVIANQTRISQENAELKKQSQKPKTIEDFFNDDPEGTLTYIDQQIMTKLNEADQLEDSGDERSARKAHREALQWEATKSTLTLKKSLATERMTKKEIERNKILAPIADFDKRKDVATRYMQTKMGMGDKDIEKMLDVDSNGIAAVNLINHFFDLNKKVVDFKESVKSKMVKKSPQELGRTGSQSELQRKDEDFEYEKEFDKAKKSGDWTKILQYKKAI